jgi:hypothetical protein
MTLSALFYKMFLSLVERRQLTIVILTNRQCCERRNFTFGTILLSASGSSSRLPSWKGFIPVWCNFKQKSIGICIEKMQAIREEWRRRNYFLRQNQHRPLHSSRGVRNSAARCTRRQQNRILILASILKILASISKILASILRILASFFKTIGPVDTGVII